MTYYEIKMNIKFIYICMDDISWDQNEYFYVILLYTYLIERNPFFKWIEE